MASVKPTHIDAEAIDGVTVVRVLTPQIRHPEPAVELGRELSSLLSRDDCRRVLIDLSRTSYLSSAAFAVLVSAARQLAAAGGRLKLCGLHPDVLMGARIIDLGRWVEIHDDERSALASF